MNHHMENFDHYAFIDGEPDADPFGHDKEVQKASRLEANHVGGAGSHNTYRELGKLPLIGSPVDPLLKPRGRHAAESRDS